LSVVVLITTACPTDYALPACLCMDDFLAAMFTTVDNATTPSVTPWC
jgi:hypothetical protein